MIVGVDEVGTGCLAGPVFAAACALPEGWQNPGVRDSKKLSPSQRDRLYDELISSVKWAVGEASVEEIDQINIMNATFLAMTRAVESFSAKHGKPSMLLVDGSRKIPKIGLPQTTVVRGDDIHAEISAASILAKVTRDRLMIRMNEEYPGYGFAGHKGYGTAEHTESLLRLGPSKIHRLSFTPVISAKHKRENNDP